MVTEVHQGWLAREFTDCSNRVLSDESDFDPSSVTDSLSGLFRQASGDKRLPSGPGIVLKSGMALCPQGAAECVKDYQRTRVFLLGLMGAIREAQKRFPGEKIRVLYAGSGPFGTLATALTPQFSPDEVEFTAIEINEISIACLKKVIRALGIERYFSDIIHADATKYRHQGLPPHIIVAEAMNFALTHEPQAAITANLGPQMEQGGIFVPECVTVSVSLSAVGGRDKIYLGEVAQLRGDARKKILGVDSRFKLPGQRVELKNYYDVFLGTNIKVFGEHELKRGESDITNGLRVGNLSPGVYENMTVKYRFGCEPLGLRVVERKHDESGNKDFYVFQQIK